MLPGHRRCRSQAGSPARSARPCLELLEDRRLLSATYYPAQVRTAYEVDQISFGVAGTNVAGNGAGQTIAIVDAGDDSFLLPTSSPNYATSDLAQFDVGSGLADPPSFTKATQNGTVTSDPSGSWELEEALDVEWAHAIAPAANIVLVECNYVSNTSQLFANLAAAAKYAATLPNVSVVSMSWGSVDGDASSPGEFFNEASYDSDFTTPSGHSNVTFLAATGDNTYSEYPAFSPNVVAVGGTTLNLHKDNSYSSETYWSGAGYGTSIDESLPAYQAAAGYTSSGRVDPDVSFDADPVTAVWVYNSSHNTKSPWEGVAGTSLGCPAWAGLVAIANQGRALLGAAPLDGASQTLPALYGMPSADFNQVSGANASVTTGLGTPKANLLVPALTSFGLSDQLDVTAEPPASVVAGAPFGFTVEALNAAGQLDTSFSGTGTVSGDGVSMQAVFQNGIAVVSATADTAATGVQMTVTVGGLSTQTQAFNVVAAAATQLVFAAPAGGQTVNSPFIVAVDAVDPFGNIDTTFQGSVQIALANNPGGSTLGGTLIVNAVSGVATFPNLTLNQTGNGYTLGVSSTGLLPASTVGFSVTTALNTPTVTGASTYENVQSSSGLVVVPNVLDKQVVTNFQITAISGGLLFQTNGTTQIHAGDFVTVAQAAAGLKFTPASGSLATGSFTVQESTSASAAGLGGPTVAASITVLPIPAATSQTIDDGNVSGFSTTNDWQTASGAGNGGGTHYAAAGSGGSTATWTFQVTPGQYQVYASWPGSASTVLASNAPYTISDGNSDLGSELVNQQIAATGSPYAGFQLLGTFNVTSTTLVVTLSNNANGQVTADSVRIVGGGIPVVAPQISVAGNQQTIPAGDTQPITDDGTNFGLATIGGSAIVETFTITNTGLGVLNLTGSQPVSLSGSSDFSIVSQPSVSSLAPGASTTLKVSFAPTTAAAETATLSIADNDSSQPNPFVFQVAGTGLPSNIQIVDNGHAGYSDDGTWLDQAQAGFEGHAEYHAAGSATALANWNFANLAPGQYQVYATWPGGFGVLSPSATYTIASGTNAQQVSVDQQDYPNGVPYLNASWQLLETVTVASGGNLQVSLNSAASGGIVVADAIAIVDLSATGQNVQSALSPLDTNRDGTIEPLDALIIINALNEQAANPADATSYVPLDALKVLNYLNAPAPAAGSAAISWSTVATAAETAPQTTRLTAVQSSPSTTSAAAAAVSSRSTLAGTSDVAPSAAEAAAGVRRAALQALAVDAVFAESAAADKLFSAVRSRER
jgi:hypothetical protein